MENNTINETLLTGSEGVTSFIDERTLFCTPAPVAASTVLKESHASRPRASRNNGGSFLNSRSLIVGELDSDRSGSDRSSLGLLPSNCLLEIENDLLFERSICLIKDAGSADTHTVASLSSENSSKKNQLTDSHSSREHTSREYTSREYTCDMNDFLTTVKKCPQAGASERDAGKYAPQALFQSVQEVDESRLNSSKPTQRDPKAQHEDKWDHTEAQKNTDSGVGQATFASQTSNGSGNALSGLGTQHSHSSGRDPRKQSTEVWDSGDLQKNGDSGMGLANFAGSQVSAVIGAVFSGLGFPIRRSAGRDNFPEGFNLAHNGDDDADQSVYQTRLDPEDLEKLENSFSDFDESSDEDCADGDTDKPELRIGAGPTDDASAQPKHLMSKMDGPFKVPLPLSTPSKFANRMYFGNQPSALTATSYKEAALQATFGDASQFRLSGSTSEWGPSIDFGSSTRIGEASNLEKDSNFLDQENQKHTFTCDPAQPQQPPVPSFGELPAGGGSRISEIFAVGEHRFGDFPNGATSEVFTDSEHLFGDFPVCKNKSSEQLWENPFGSFAGDVTGEEFGDENFMLDADAAAAMLAEDEKLFKNDHLSGNETLNLTQVSMRGADQTFMNMSIGTYMAAGSGEMGSLNSQSKRPDIGMPVTSPPNVRSSGPLLTPEKVFRSPDGNTTQQITDGGQECFRNALFSLDNTDSSVVLEDNPQKKSLIEETQDTSLPCDLSSFLVTASQKTSQNDGARTSSKVESPSLQTPVSTGTVTNCETSTKEARTGDLKSVIACEQRQQTPTAAAIIQQPPESPASGEADHDRTLAEAEMSMTKLEDKTQNYTSDQITFSNIHNLIDCADTSVTNLGDLLLSQYNKMVKGKQAAKQSKQMTEKKDGGKVLEADKALPRPVTHLHDIAKTSSSALVTSHRKGESHIPVQAMTAAGTDVSELEIQQLKNITGTTETLEKRLASINKDSTTLLPVSQSSKDLRQSIERQQLQIFSNTSKPQVHPSQIDNRKVEHKINSGVANAAVKQVNQEGYSQLAAAGSQQGIANTKSLKPPELNVSNKSILPEKIDGQQRDLFKVPATKNLSATAQRGHQLTLQSVSEESMIDDSSLESFTINSTYFERARSTKQVATSAKTVPVRPPFLQEKVKQLSVVRPREIMPSLDNLHLLLNATENTTHGDVSNISQFDTLMHDNSRSLMDYTEMQNKLFVSSTPYTAHRPGWQKIANFTQLTENTILPVVTPQTALDILEVPETVCIPEVCCVSLSLQSSFVVKNLLNKGVRCLMTIGEATFNSHRINSNHCPFELKGQVVLSPSSSQEVQVVAVEVTQVIKPGGGNRLETFNSFSASSVPVNVLFRPKNQGEYTVNVEIRSQNMTNPQENRTYILHLSGCSEEPALQISAVNDEIDFGEMIWGSTSCRSINIKNVGRATIPLRCSIFRKESALCNFTFHPENATDVSSISLTTRPAQVGTVYSLSLPGKKDGQKILMETINIYCCAKESQNLAMRYMEKAEKFQAILTICVDVPIEDVLPLCKVKLQVIAGMYKLHVDKDTLPIIASPGKTGHGTVQIINSGNITMPVSISLEPWRDHFAISATNVLVPSGANCPVHVTFTPQATREEQGDNIVNVMLQTPVSHSYIALIGKIKATKILIRCSVIAVNFGGVNVGQVQKQKVVFYVDNDESVRVFVRNQEFAFKLLNDDGNCVDSLDVSAKKGQKNSVFVLFSPSEVKGYSADLIIQVLYANRYSIPLNGYGGRSQVLIEDVHQNDTRDLSMDIGHLHPGQTVVRKFTVRNIGVRACYIKASLYDTSRQALEVSHCAVNPAALILSANEAYEVSITMNPSKKEADLCAYKCMVVAILKLAWGDEVARQHFVLHPGQQSQKLVHDFDIPLSSTQKQLVQSELKDLHLPEDSYSVLKNGMTVNRIGLYGVPLENPTLPVTNTTARMEPNFNRPASCQRPVLTPVNANIKPMDSGKKMWALNPTEIHFNGGVLKVKDYVQVINMSTAELEFSVEFDNKYVTVAPSKGIVPAMNTALLDIHNNIASLSTKESSYLTTIRVNCSQQTQCVKVNISGTSDRPSPKPSVRPLADRGPSLSTPAVKLTTAPVHINKPPNLDCDRGSEPKQPPGKLVEQAGRNSPVTVEDREGSSERIQGLGVATLGATEAGTRRDEVYSFTNVSTEPLTWKLAAFASPYVTLPDNPHSLFRVDYEVFKLSPLDGVLQPYETEKVHIRFSPQCQGSYNQAWCVHDTADSQGSFHRFTIYAKASPSSALGRAPCQPGIIPQGLSPTHFSKSPRGKHIQKSLGTSRPAPPTRANSSEANRPLMTGSTVEHSSQVENRTMRPGVQHSGSSGVQRSGSSGVQRSGSSGVQRSGSSGVQRSGSSGVQRSGSFGSSPALINRSNLASQRPSSAGSPGVSWIPVSQSKDASHHASPVGSQAPSSDAVMSRVSARRGVGSPSVTKDTETSLVTSDSLKSLTPRESGSSGDEDPFRGENGMQQSSLNLLRKVIKFPGINIGDCIILKICVQNTSDEESQVVVDQAPKPPFLIKHYSFKVRKNKVVKFPVTCKPRHIGKFEDVVVFRNTRTGNTVTATLLAECVNTLGDISDDGAFSQS